MYVIRTNKRNALGTWLSKNGISTAVHYPLPVHRQPAYAKYSETILSFTEEWSRTVLSIPIHPNLSSRDQEFVISMVTRFFDERLYERKEVQEHEKLWTAKLI
jgi:dTDP-4-amino-4,6-dideoxygalactose transaminase